MPDLENSLLNYEAWLQRYLYLCSKSPSDPAAAPARFLKFLTFATQSMQPCHNFSGTRGQNQIQKHSVQQFPLSLLS
jgi:hypothetical protein